MKYLAVLFACYDQLLCFVDKNILGFYDYMGKNSHIGQSHSFKNRLKAVPLLFLGMLEDVL